MQRITIPTQSATTGTSGHDVDSIAVAGEMAGRAGSEADKALSHFCPPIYPDPRDNPYFDDLLQLTLEITKSICPENGIVPAAAMAAKGRKAIENPLKVVQGQLTFEAEGNDDPKSIYYSRRPHVPSAVSGLTLGRGYDMKFKSAQNICADLTAAGIDEGKARLLSAASGLVGDEAKQFIETNHLTSFTITQDQQKKLFASTYKDVESDVRRICEKPDTIELYGRVDWDNLNPKIRDVVVDLRYRGDYTPASRAIIQKCVADNDYKGFCGAMKDKNNWPNVPSDRFQRRVDFLEP